MQKNIGSTDKIIRYIVGIAIIGAGIYFKTWWGLAGIIPIAVAVAGRCPAYLPFGLSTIETKKK